MYIALYIAISIKRLDMSRLTRGSHSSGHPGGA